MYERVATREVDADAGCVLWIGGMVGAEIGVSVCEVSLENAGVLVFLVAVVREMEGVDGSW